MRLAVLPLNPGLMYYSLPSPIFFQKKKKKSRSMNQTLCLPLALNPGSVAFWLVFHLNQESTHVLCRGAASMNCVVILGLMTRVTALSFGYQSTSHMKVRCHRDLSSGRAMPSLIGDFRVCCSSEGWMGEPQAGLFYARSSSFPH